MFKNIVIAVLAACCIFLVVNQRMERAARGEEEISPAEYGGLAALRDVIPAEEYRAKVLPLLQEALKDGKMTRDQLAALGAKLGDLEHRRLPLWKESAAGQVRQGLERCPDRSEGRRGGLRRVVQPSDE